MIKKLVKKIFRTFGLDVVRSHPMNYFPGRLLQAFHTIGIDTIFDVGANMGQFAVEMREAGFAGSIVSFEPLSEAHLALTRRAGKYPNWKVHPRCAVGKYDGEVMINVANNSVSSSILDMTRAHTDAAADSIYVNRETVPIVKLDSVASQYIENDSRVFLKIDTQGFEWPVLDGAVLTLPFVKGILVEASIVELYVGQPLWDKTIKRLEDQGFVLWSIDRVFTDFKNGRTLQYDLVFLEATCLLNPAEMYSETAVCPVGDTYI